MHFDLNKAFDYVLYKIFEITQRIFFSLDKNNVIYTTFYFQNVIFLTFYDMKHKNSVFFLQFLSQFK